MTKLYEQHKLNFILQIGIRLAGLDLRSYKSPCPVQPPVPNQSSQVYYKHGLASNQFNFLNNTNTSCLRDGRLMKKSLYRLYAVIHVETLCKPLREG